MRKILSCFIFIVMIFSFAGCSININTASANSENEKDSQSKNDENTQSVQETNEDTESTIDNVEDNDKVQNNPTENNDAESEIQKKIVVIDPGHASKSNLQKEKECPNSDKLKIKDGGGADGISTKTPEYVINMKVSNKLKAMLEEHNITVIMTKTDNDVSLGNIERANIGNENNADLVIRIHCDSSENQKAAGSSMLVPANVGYAGPICETSRKYGTTILNSLVSTCNTQNRGVVERNDMTGFNWSKVPVVLVEMGFLSNPNEDVKLNNDEYQTMLAQGLCDGILKALNEN